MPPILAILSEQQVIFYDMLSETWYVYIHCDTEVYAGNITMHCFMYVQALCVCVCMCGWVGSWVGLQQ